MWSKLVFLGPLALTTTAFDRTVGEVMADPKTWQQLEGSIREACAIAQADGAKVDADAVLKIIKNAPAGMRNSMQKDVELRARAGTRRDWRGHRAGSETAWDEGARLQKS